MITVHLADCMDIMKSYPDGWFDLAVVDPEFGNNDAIGIKNNNGLNKQATKRTDYKVFKNIAPDEIYWSELKRVAKHQIIWGG